MKLATDEIAAHADFHAHAEVGYELRAAISSLGAAGELTPIAERAQGWISSGEQLASRHLPGSSHSLTLASSRRELEAILSNVQNRSAEIQSDHDNGKLDGNELKQAVVDLRSTLADAVAVILGEIKTLLEVLEASPQLPKPDTATSEARLGLAPNAEFGPYKLISRLGKGGNGEVWRANDKQAGARAIKFLRNSLYSGKAYSRFRAEVSAMAECSDIRGVLSLLDSNTPAKPTIDDPPWLVMPVATPLPKVKRRLDALSDLVAAFSELSMTMKEVHERGIAHRDIKPENLFFYDGRWMVGDFGLASIPDKKALTAAGKKLGPVYYIAPEMLNSPDTADGKKADVFSMAKTLWVLGTGQKYPIPGQLRADDELTRLDAYNSGPRADLLRTVLEDATSNNPEDRPTMAEFHNELVAWQNPVESSATNPSLKNLAARIEAVAGDSLRSQDGKKKAEASATKLLDGMVPGIRPIHQELEAAFKGQVNSIWGKHGTSNTTVLTSCDANSRLSEENRLVVTGRSITVSLRIPDATFWCGVALEISHSNQAHLAAGYCAAIGGYSVANDIRCLGCDHYEFRLDSADQQAKITSAVAALADRLSPSVAEFINMIESATREG